MRTRETGREREFFSYRDAGKIADGGVGGQGSKGDHFDVVVMTSEF